MENVDGWNSIFASYLLLPNVAIKAYFSEISSLKKGLPPLFYHDFLNSHECCYNIILSSKGAYVTFFCCNIQNSLNLLSLQINQ